MDVESVIQELLERRTSSSVARHAVRNKKIGIYATGLKSKLRQAHFALKKLEEAVSQKGIMDVRKTEHLSDSEVIEFYNDCFWTFLYSAFEILAQVVNQARNLIKDEKKVYFKGITKLMIDKYPSDPVTEKLKNAMNSRSYLNIDRYRQCCEHRRPILVQYETREVTVTSAYADSSSALRQETILICDNPLKLIPKTRQRRDIVQYSAWALEQSEKRLIAVLDKLLR